MNTILAALVLVLFAHPVHAAKKSARAPAVVEATGEAMSDENTPIAAKLVVESTAGESEAAIGLVKPAAVEAAVLPGEMPAAEVKPASAADVAKLPETQIPVLTGTKEIKKTSAEGYTRLLLTLGVLVVGLGATLFGLKRFAARRGMKKTSTKIQVLTQYSMGPKKSLAIVQVAGEAILIGITDHNISMLKTLALIDDEIPEQVPNNFGTTLDDFEEEVSPARLSGKRRDQDEDFTMQGLSEIRDTVSKRIKSSRNA